MIEVTLRRADWQDIADHLYDLRRERGFSRQPLVDERGLWLVEAFEAGKLLAFATVVGLPGDERGCLIDEIAVSVGNERRGVGRALVRAAAASMARAGFHTMSAYTVGGSDDFFARMGFRPSLGQGGWKLDLVPPPTHA